MNSTPEPPAPGDEPEPASAPDQTPAPGADTAGDAASPSDASAAAAAVEPPPAYAPPPEGYAPPGQAGYAPPGAYPGAATPASAPPLAGAQPPGTGKRPPVWAGLLTGLGAQIAGLVVMVMLLSVTFSVSIGNWGILILLLPFIILLVGPALLLMSWRWRRFATGMLIISAAVWLVIIGPCLGLAMGV